MRIHTYIYIYIYIYVLGVDRNGEKHHVPEILVSGHHEQIKEWRTKKSVEVTKKTRPDLLKKNFK